MKKIIDAIAELFTFAEIDDHIWYYNWKIDK